MQRHCRIRSYLTTARSHGRYTLSQPSAMPLAATPRRHRTQHDQLISIPDWLRLHLGEELADVAIYLLGLAEMTGVDLQDEIEAKKAKNAARAYQCLPTGVLAKSKDDAD